MARRASFKTVPVYLIYMGGILSTFGLVTSLLDRELAPFLIAGGLGIPMVALGIAVMVAPQGAANARQRFAKRRQEEIARAQRLSIARAHGAEPGQLMEAPPESGSGDVSIASEPGAISLARAKEQKS